MRITAKERGEIWENKATRYLLLFMILSLLLISGCSQPNKVPTAPIQTPICASGFAIKNGICEFNTSPLPNPYATTQQAGPKQPTPNIQPGKYCSVSGAKVTYNGKIYTCKTSPTDSKLRWRQ